MNKALRGGAGGAIRKRMRTCQRNLQNKHAAMYNKNVKSKVYVETSVISYLTARPSRDILIAANQQVTQEWWQERRPKFDLYISQLVEQEISSGNAEAVANRRQVLSDCTFLEITPEAVKLAERLIEKNAVPRQAAEDALHIAIATVSGVDYLLTWNFKHIANAAIRANVELVCRLNGYEPPVICSPMELMEV
jgi:predicted nucleic acid-binding protein